MFPWALIALLGLAVVGFSLLMRDPRPIPTPASFGILHPGEPMYPWLEKRELSFGAEHDLLVVGFWHKAYRAGVTLEMTVTDCYSSAWVREPLFGGPPRWVRYLDDAKVARKMELVFGEELRRLGWLEEPAPGWADFVHGPNGEIYAP